MIRVKSLPRKKWISPQLIPLSTQQINSGNTSDYRPGEFIVQPVLTSCPFSNATCVPAGSYMVYATGKINDQVICYGDSTAISTAIYLPICS